MVVIRSFCCYRISAFFERRLSGQADGPAGKIHQRGVPETKHSAGSAMAPMEPTDKPGRTHIRRTTIRLPESTYGGSGVFPRSGSRGKNGIYHLPGAFGAFDVSARKRSRYFQTVFLNYRADL